jgi:hypothetical protein
MQSAKFPKKPPITAYQRIMPHFREFLRNGNGETSYFDLHRAKLTTQAKNEIGTEKSEILRCIMVIDAFIATYSSGKLQNLKFGHSYEDVAFKVAGVSVNCRLSPPILETAKNGALNSGGCVMFTASTAQARKNIENRTKFVAATVHWALEKVKVNIEPLPKLCLSFDIFGQNVVRAPTAYSRLRTRMEDSCQEVANDWALIEPPADYDGPPWQ